MSDVMLDLRSLPADRQLAELRKQYAERRGEVETASPDLPPGAAGVMVRALVDDQPVRLYVSLLESGFRVSLERREGAAVLVLDPDGSTARTVAGAHSIATHPEGRVYVTTNGDSVAVLDAASRRVLRHIGVGAAPQHLEFSPDHARLYVANGDSNDVSIVDTASDDVVATAPAGRRPMLPCVSPDGCVYLPSGPSATLSVLSAAGALTATLPVGQAPHDVAVSPDARWAYQPNSASHSLTIVDARTHEVTGEIRVGLAPGHIAFSPDARLAFVANTMSDDVSVIDVSNHEVVATIPAGRAAHLPLLSHDGRRGYVANFGSDDLAVWDADSCQGLGRIPVGIYPHAFGISPDDRWIVVSNTGEASVCIVDAGEQRTVATLAVGGAPSHVAFDPAGECAFVACQRSNQVAVVDLSRQRLVDLIDVGLAAA